ncbi:MAG: hypothetical protein N2109_12695, partial [Fimbriimonadales bacterium]|nr:hypothetical protein [Fimbriimonadales bacterium]
MPLDWRTEWEVRTDGNDNWGGGFFAGRTGATKTATDNYTYGPSYQAWTGTDLIINSTTNTLVRSPSRPFANADIGHVIQITGGTGFTTGFYEITGSVVDGSDVWWSLDRAAGTAGS